MLILCATVAGGDGVAHGGVPNKVQVGDMGIDGTLFPVGTKPADQNNMFAGDWFPIQVK